MSARCNPPSMNAQSPEKLAPWGLPRLYALRGMGRGLLSAVGFRCSCGPLWGLQGLFSLVRNENKFYLELTSALKDGIIES